MDFDRGLLMRIMIIAERRKIRLVALLPFLFLHFVLPSFGDLTDAAPGQPIEDQLYLSASELGQAPDLTARGVNSNWQLLPNTTNNITTFLTIRANRNWQIMAKDNDPITSGHMTQWTGSGYGPLKLASPMRVQAAYEVTLPSEKLVQTGRA